MHWSSATRTQRTGPNLSGNRHRLRRWFRAMALGSLFGCAEGALFETQVLVVAETESCEDARMSRPEPGMNVYQVAVYALDPAAAVNPDEPACVRCRRPSEACELVELRCGCGEFQRLGTTGINRGLAGLQFPSLDPDRAHCVQFSAFSVPEVRATGETQECDCAFGGVDLTGRARMCGISPFAGSVAENAPALVVSADCGLRCENLAIEP